jgi:hypothetical protein
MASPLYLILSQDATATRGDIAVLISHLTDLVDVLERQDRREVNGNDSEDATPAPTRKGLGHRDADRIQLNVFAVFLSSVSNLMYFRSRPTSANWLPTCWVGRKKILHSLKA